MTTSSSIPIFFAESKESSQGAMLSWYKREKPDAILCIQIEPLAWLRAAGFKVPEDVSLVHLDTSTTGEQWAGMKTDRHSRGAIAIDIIVAQINCNETGVPLSQRATLTQSSWTTGSTLKGSLASTQAPRFAQDETPPQTGRLTAARMHATSE